MTTLKVNTQVGSDAIPEYVEHAAGNSELEAYRKSVDDVYNSYLHPVEEVQSNKASLEQRTQVFEGFSDENMIVFSSVNGTAKIEKVVTSKL